MRLNEYEYEYYLYNKYQRIRIRILFTTNISMNTTTIREWNYSNNLKNTNYSLLPAPHNTSIELHFHHQLKPHLHLVHLLVHIVLLLRLLHFLLHIHLYYFLCLLQLHLYHLHHLHHLPILPHQRMQGHILENWWLVVFRCLVCLVFR